MSAPVFIGDELTAAGFRLAGLTTHVPAADDTADVLAEARQSAPLVLITAECAARVPAAQLEPALAACTPLVVVVPDLRELTPPPDLGAQWRGQLEGGS